MNVFYNTIVFVNDIKKSKLFYEEVIGLKAKEDLDSIVFFENHFVIHDKSKIYKTIYESDMPIQRVEQSNLLIYFETDDIDESFQTISKNNIEIIHPIKEQSWGQRVFRFYDPDGHIVEIGEAMHLDYLKQKGDGG